MTIEGGRRAGLLVALTLTLVLALLGSSSARASSGSAYLENLLANSTAEGITAASDETDMPPITPWDTMGLPMTAIQYGHAGAPQYVPPYVGKGSAFANVETVDHLGHNLFAGGPTSLNTTAVQTVDVGKFAQDIDSSQVSATLFGYLGGKGAEDSQPSIELAFLSGADEDLGARTLGPVTAADRGNATKLLFQHLTGRVPPQTRKIRVTMIAAADPSSGGYNHAFFDNIGLVLNLTTTPVQVHMTLQNHQPLDFAALSVTQGHISGSHNLVVPTEVIKVPINRSPDASLGPYLPQGKNNQCGRRIVREGDAFHLAAAVGHKIAAFYATALSTDGYPANSGTVIGNGVTSYGPRLTSLCIEERTNTAFKGHNRTQIETLTLSLPAPTRGHGPTGPVNPWVF